MKWTEFRKTYCFRPCEKCCGNCKHGEDLGIDGLFNCRHPELEDRNTEMVCEIDVCNAWEAQGRVQ